MLNPMKKMTSTFVSYFQVLSNFEYHYLYLDRSHMNSSSPSIALALFWLELINNLILLNSLGNKSNTELL